MRFKKIADGVYHVTTKGITYLLSEQELFRKVWELNAQSLA